MDLFRALDRCPLTVRQLLKLSGTFAYPFTSERRVQERLRRLCAVGRVRRWTYATAGQGALSYYTLAPLGYRLLHGGDAIPSGRGLFGPVGVARQAHTRALAEVVIHLFTGASRAGVPVAEFWRENTLRLQTEDESLYPDAAFALLPEGARFSYFVELDNCTESVRSPRRFDTLQRKVQFYERYQDLRAERFRVLVISTGGTGRLQHILECAGVHARNPRRSLVYATTFRDFLQTQDPLRDSCFRNHAGQSVSLVGAFPYGRRQFRLTAEPALLV